MEHTFYLLDSWQGSAVSFQSSLLHMTSVYTADVQCVLESHVETSNAYKVIFFCLTSMAVRTNTVVHNDLQLLTPRSLQSRCFKIPFSMRLIDFIHKFKVKLQLQSEVNVLFCFLLHVICMLSHFSAALTSMLCDICFLL